MKKQNDLVGIMLALAKCFFILVIFILVPNTISLIVRLIIKDTDMYLATSVPIMMASYAIIVLFFAIQYWFQRKSLFESAGIVKTSYGISFSSCLLGIGTYGVIQAIMFAAAFILPKSWLELQNDHSSSIMSGGMVVAVIYTIVVAPFCEELVFRGLLTETLNEKAPKFAVVLLPAVLFSLVHLPSPIAILYTFVLGIVLGIIRLRTKSLVPCILLHSLFNATNYMLYIPKSIGLYIVWAVSIPLIVLATISIIRQTKKGE